MTKVKIYNLKGEVIREEELDSKFFALKVNPLLVQQVVEAQLANRRQVLAQTKGRGEVRGGGRKPWRQKGTGRARHGSIRSPLWRGGGVTFGPTSERNFTVKINKKMKKQALKMVLSNKASHQKIIVVDDLKIEAAKTRKLKEVLNNLPLKDKSTLIILLKKDMEIIRSAKNLRQVDTLPFNSLNVVDLLKFEYLLIPLAALKQVSEFYS